MRVVERSSQSTHDRVAFNVLAGLAVVAATVLALQARVGEDACTTTGPPDASASSSSVSLVPPGLTCTYTLEGGGIVTQGPGVALAAAAILVLVVIGVGLVWPPTRLWRALAKVLTGVVAAASAAALALVVLT